MALKDRLQDAGDNLKDKAQDAFDDDDTSMQEQEDRDLFDGDQNAAM